MYNAYPSVASTSLSASGTIAEEYIPLWVYSSGTTGGSSFLSASTFIGKGTPNYYTTNTSSQAKLYTLNSNWSSGQKFAFEASIYTNNASATAYASLWDMTSNAQVSGSVISTTATTATLLRSGVVTLIPGHVYGVSSYTSNGSYLAYLTKAHLVALEL